jgi:hypothetical protein
MQVRQRHRVRSRLSLFPIGAALIYLALPGYPLGWLTGLPLRPLGLATLVALALVLFAASPLGRIPRAFQLLWLFVVLAALKLAMAVAAPTYGLEASYYVKTGTAPVPERSTEFPNLAATRLDRRLSFEAEGFPLYFLNDNVRFNFYRDNEPDRSRLPFSARWSGLIEIPAEGEYRFWLTAIGSARLSLAGDTQLGVDSLDQPRTTEQRVMLAQRAQPIELDYARRAGQPARLVVEWDDGGGRVALAAPFIRARSSAVPLSLASPLLWFSHALDLLFLAGLGVLSVLLLRSRPTTSLERPLLAVVLAAVFVYSGLSTLDLRDRVVILDGGADWLTYETYTRDILLNGPLMTLGKALGKGRPFYFQPFYPYALAAAHFLTGEDLYGVVVLQLFGLGVTAVLGYSLAKRLFGRPSGVLTLALIAAVLGPLHLEWVARHLLSENIYFWMLPATALLFLSLAERPTRALAVLTGAFLGFCCVTRAPTLLWVPPALAVTYRRSKSELPYVGLAALACSAVVSLVPLRNFAVSGQPSLVATNGMATMQLAHPLTPLVELRGAERNPIYHALRLDPDVIHFLEFIRQDPKGYAATLVPLGLYALGIPGTLEDATPVRWELVSLVALYLLSLFLPAARRPAAWLLHSFIWLHFLVMMVFLPNVYGYRQVLPMYLFMAVFAGYALATLAGRISTTFAHRPELRADHSGQRQSVNQHVAGTGAPAGYEELA